MQSKILDYFKVLKEKNLLGSSYLFIGSDYSLVYEVIKMINCVEDNDYCDKCWDCKQINQMQHPDMVIVSPEPTTIKIERVREAQKALSLRSYRLPKKVVVIQEAESMSLAAANAFLKTLEEPPKNSFIAVCASRMEGLLPTIVSRCRKIFLPFKESTADTSILGDLRLFLEGERIRFGDRKKLGEFLWTFIVLMRDRLVQNSTDDEENLILPKGYKEMSSYLRINDKESIENLLTNLLQVYSAYKTVNENLALQLVKTAL